MKSLSVKLGVIFVTIWLFISCSLLTNSSLAQPKPPDGIGGLNWGDSLEKLKEKVNLDSREIQESGNTKAVFLFPVIKNYLKKIGEANISTCTYTFSNRDGFFFFVADFPKD